MTSQIRVPAIATQQSPGKILYQFAVDGKALHSFAAVSRIHRDADHAVQGYQRPEALKHIASIRHYIESASPMIPNGIVIAFDGSVKFEPTGPSDGWSQVGEIVIPIGDGDKRPGWIVDGQQRSAAIREARVEAFPIPVTAFITDDPAEQREQFILVNSTKPLPKSLIYELLPGTVGLLPPALARRKISAQLLEALNNDPDSPFHWRIQTATNPDGIIKDNSVLRMLDNSIIEGYLYNFRDPDDGSGDIPEMARFVNNFWSAVAQVFPNDWHSIPRRSRLVHGAGIVSMGFLMDAMADRLHGEQRLSKQTFVVELGSISEQCCWSTGEWRLSNGEWRRWNSFQNTSRDVQLLTDHLLSLYRRARTRS